MLKSILKVLYISFGIIIAFFVYMLSYNTNAYSYIQGITMDAIEAKDYAEVAMIHGGCFDKRNIAVENDDKFDLAVFPSTTLSTYNYYTNPDSEDTESVITYDNSYYIYIFNPTFNMTSYTINSKSLNDLAIRFNSTNGSYLYNLEVSNTINSDLYAAKPSNLNESVLKSQRSANYDYTNWHFINVTLTKTMIDEMQSSLNGNISSFTIIDSDGKEVSTIDIQLDFSQAFFTDVSPLVQHYNEYIENYQKASDEDDKDAMAEAENKFNEFYLDNEETGTKGFESTFPNEYYTFRHVDSYLRPSSLIWKTIGIIVLYLLCAFILYILLFHFNTIKSIFMRNNNNRNGYKGRYTPKGEVINAKASDLKSKEVAKANTVDKKTVIDEKTTSQPQIQQTVENDSQADESIEKKD